MPPAIPASTKTSLAQRLRAHATDTWSPPATIHVRYHGQFAYVDAELDDGTHMPLIRLRYGGSAHRWGLAIHLAGSNRYEDQTWFTGSPQQALDLVHDLYTNANR